MQKIRTYINPQVYCLTLLDASSSSACCSVTSSFLPPQERSIIFSVKAEDYSLEAGMDNHFYYLIRNGQQVETPINNRLTDRVKFSWQPERLKIEIQNDSSSSILQVLETELTIPPNSLREYVRKEMTLPITYESPSHFYQVVTATLQSVPDKVMTVGMQDAFWDVTDLDFKGRKPKNETDILPTIEGLLYDIALVRNFYVSRDHYVASGKLDFLISGYLKTGEMTSVCVEFKHAHSNDLHNGLLKQLPFYMRSKGCDFGLYCVLFFKGKFLDAPANLKLNTVESTLSELAKSSGIKNIRILVFDFSYPIAPSKL